MKKTKILALLLAVSVLCSMLMVMPVSAATTPQTQAVTRTFEYVKGENSKYMTNFDGDFDYTASLATNYFPLKLKYNGTPTFTKGVYGKNANDTALSGSGYLFLYGGFTGNTQTGDKWHIRTQFAPDHTKTGAQTFSVAQFQKVYTDSERTTQGTMGVVNGNYFNDVVAFVRDAEGNKSVKLFQQFDIPYVWADQTWYDVDIVLTAGENPTCSVYIDGEPLTKPSGTFDGLKTTSVDVAIDGAYNEAGVQGVWGMYYNSQLRYGCGGGYIDNMEQRVLRVGDPVLADDTYEAYKSALATAGLTAVETGGSDATEGYWTVGGGWTWKYLPSSWGHSDIFALNMDVMDEKGEGKAWYFELGSYRAYIWGGESTKANRMDNASAQSPITTASYKNWTGDWINHSFVIDAYHGEVKQQYIGGIPQLENPFYKVRAGYSGSNVDENGNVVSTVSDQVRFNNQNTKVGDVQPVSQTGIDNAYISRQNYKPQIKSLTYGTNGTDDRAVPYNTTSIKLNLAGAIWQPEADMAAELAKITLAKADGTSVAIANRAYDATNRTVTLTLAEGALEGDTSYQVKMDKTMEIYDPAARLAETALAGSDGAKTIADISGGSDYVYDFQTTTAPVFEITKAEFLRWNYADENEDGEADGGWKNHTYGYVTDAQKKINAKITFKNTYDEAKEVRLIYVVYSGDDTLQKFYMAPTKTTIPANSEAFEVLAAGEDGVLPSNTNRMKVKVYVWDDVTTMTPVHDSSFYLWQGLTNDNLMGKPSAQYCGPDATPTWIKAE